MFEHIALKAAHILLILMLIAGIFFVMLDTAPTYAASKSSKTKQIATLKKQNKALKAQLNKEKKAKEAAEDKALSWKVQALEADRNTASANEACKTLRNQNYWLWDVVGSLNISYNKETKTFTVSEPPDNFTINHTRYQVIKK